MGYHLGNLLLRQSEGVGRSVLSGCELIEKVLFSEFDELLQAILPVF